MNPSEYSSQPQDAKRELEVLKWLRGINAHDKFEFIWRVLKIDTGLGLPLVKKAQLNPVYLEVILEHGFVYGDASTIRWWYEATVQGLGERRVVELVASHINNAPLVVDKMLYWLRPENEAVQKLVLELKHEFETKYPNFKSTRSTGIHATGA